MSDVGRLGSGADETAERFCPADFADPAAASPPIGVGGLAPLCTRPESEQRADERQMRVRVGVRQGSGTATGNGTPHDCRRAANRTEIGRHSTAVLRPSHPIIVICTHCLHAALQHITAFSTCAACAISSPPHPPPAHTPAPPLIDSPRSRPPPRPAVGIMVDIDSDAEYARRLQDEVRREARLQLQRGVAPCSQTGSAAGGGHSECQLSPDCSDSHITHPNVDFARAFLRCAIPCAPTLSAGVSGRWSPPHGERSRCQSGCRRIRRIDGSGQRLCIGWRRR